MSKDDEMIRRGDVLATLDAHANGTINIGGQTFRTIQLGEATEAIAALPAVPSMPKNLRVTGVGREPECRSALTVYFSRSVSDDDMRQVHDALRAALARLGVAE